MHTHKQAYTAILALPLLCSLSACALFSQKTARLDKVRVMDPENVAITEADPLAAGRKMLNDGNYGSAIGAFHIALTQKPNSSAAANGLAIAYDAIGRADLAQRYFELAMGNDPSNESYRNNYRRFAQAQADRSRQLAASDNRAAMPRAAKPADQQLIRLSLGEVRLELVRSDGAASGFSPPFEIRLSQLKHMDRLTAPVSHSGLPAQPDASPTLGELASAVDSAQHRIMLTAHVIDTTGRCHENGKEAQCAS